MKDGGVRRLLLLLMVFAAPGCGLGFADDTGTPAPPESYWGWQCADGTSADGGCLPGACSDGSKPGPSDGGCACADGTQVLASKCD